MTSGSSDVREAFLQEALIDFTAQPTFLLRLKPHEAWALLHQLQLAQHHPRARGPLAYVARQVGLRIQEYIAPSGTARARIAARGWEPAHDPALPSALQLREALAQLVDRAQAAEAVLSTLAQQDEARGAYYEGLARELAAAILAVAPGAYPAPLAPEQTE